MSKIVTVGLDLPKNVFQVYGADETRGAVLRWKLRRDHVLSFFSQLPRGIVVMEACGGAYFWGREIGRLGHEVRLISPVHVEPFVKRQKNDAAEAICELATRPTMRFVPVKSEETQRAAMSFRVRELLIRQRTQIINCCAAIWQNSDKSYRKVQPTYRGWLQSSKIRKRPASGCDNHAWGIRHRAHEP